MFFYKLLKIKQLLNFSFFIKKNFYNKQTLKSFIEENKSCLHLESNIVISN